MDQAARIDALTEENARLSDEIATLRRLLGQDVNPWVGLGLTASEARLFGLLAKRGQATKDQLHHLCGVNHDGETPDPKIVDVFICKMRKKLGRYDVQIETVWGQGYRIAPDHLARARELAGTAPC